jgi:integrase
MIRKTKTGFQVDISLGRTKRHRKAFKTRQEAQAYERHFLAQLDEGKEWQPQAKDKRKLSDLIAVWHKLHGVNLRDEDNRLKTLNNTANALGDPVAKDFTANQFSHYRAERLKKVKPKTINNETVYLSSVYNELRRLKEIDYDNPIAKVRQIKIPERELSYLSDDDIKALFDELKTHQPTYQVALICLSCGTRWGEALSLKKEHIRGGKISLFNTKSGKNRYIPIPKNVLDLLNFEFDEACTKIFAKCYKRAEIPKTIGQNTHILRHTFASHFIANGGGILTLKNILGHSDLKMTMRYAHLAPDHLKDVLKFSPVVKMLS